MNSAISVRHLTKDFRIGIRGLKLRAVDDLSLEIPRGQVYGLLGPNGCGKSTTLKIVLGLVSATAGEISILGQPFATSSARRRTGFLPEAPYFHKFLTGRELVRYCAQLAQLDLSTVLNAEMISPKLRRKMLKISLSQNSKNESIHSRRRSTLPFVGITIVIFIVLIFLMLRVV